MKSGPPSRRSGNSERGYALLMAVFLVATMALAASMAVPSVLNEGRREREQEVIWRGNQYVRAIRLYYQKNGHFPQSMDDLTKASNNGTYFLRKAYTDLTDPDEQGEWRLIYASPTGQLTGSVRYHSLQEMALMQGLGTAQNNALAAAAAAQGGTGSLGQAMPGQAQASGGLGQSGGRGLPGGSGQTPGTQGSQFAPEPISDGPVFGGYLVGVGCKLKKPSLMVYKGGKTYYEWEFIWNPLTVSAIASPGGGAVPGLSLPNTGGAIGSVLGLPGSGAVPGAPGAAPPGVNGMQPNPNATGTGAPAAPQPPPNGEVLQAPSDSPTPPGDGGQAPATPSQ